MGHAPLDHRDRGLRPAVHALAGADLNGDGDGGAIPGPDRARRIAADVGSSVGRNSENLPSTFTVDLRLSKRFRFGGRAGSSSSRRRSISSTASTIPTSTTSSAPAPSPTSRSGTAQGRVTYGTFTAAQPPRQIQLAAKVSF